MNKTKILLIFTSAVFLFSISAFPKNKKTSVEIKHKSRDLEKITAELTKKRQEQQKLKEETQKISENVQQKQTKILDVEKSLLFTLKRTGEVKQQLAESTLEYEDSMDQLRSNKEKLKSSVKQYYLASRLQTPASPLSVYTRQMIKSQVTHLEGFRGEQEKAKKELDTLTNTYQLYRQEADNQNKIIGSLKYRKEEDTKRLRKFKSRQEVLSAELKDLETTAQELASLIDILRSRARKEKAEEKRARLEKSLSGESPIPRNSLPWPIVGKVRTPFGRQKHPRLGTPYISNGVIIGSDKSQSVRVVSDGHVLYAGDFMSYGPMTVVEHPGDWYSVYGNMAKWSVEKGQELRKGDVVGWSGVSDKGENQAYFELRFYGKPTNPLPWLQKSQIRVANPK